MSWRTTDAQNTLVLVPRWGAVAYAVAGVFVLRLLKVLVGGRIAATGDLAREWLHTPSTSDLAPIARDRFVAKAKEESGAN